MSLNSTPGDAGAESYFAVSDADAYFAARSNAAWAAGSTSAKETAARLGTQYLENAYRDRWVGLTVTQIQSLAWPRVDGVRGGQHRAYGFGWTFPLYDINGWPIDTASVPVQIQRAAMEAALMSLSGVSLEPTLVRGNAIKQTKTTVDVISTQIEYMPGAPVFDRYLVIEGLLRGLVTSTPGAPSGNTKLARS